MVSKMYKEMYSRWLAANLDDPDLKPEQRKLVDNALRDFRLAGCLLYTSDAADE